MHRMNSQEEYDRWLQDFPNLVQDFLGYFEAEFNEKLGLDLESIDRLESHFLVKYPDIPSIMKFESSIVEGAGCYVGEVFRTLIGGDWDIILDDEESADLGIPCINRFWHSYPQARVVPKTWVTASLARRTGHYIRDRFEYWFHKLRSDEQ